MLKIVSNSQKIIQYQKLLKDTLSKECKSEGMFTLGYPGGSMKCRVRHNEKIWFIARRATRGTPRFWNGFGLVSKLDPKISNNILVEINIPTGGVNKSVGGLFAIDDKTDDVILMHRGKVGGGRKGIGKKAFLSRYANQRQPTMERFYDDANNEEEALVVGTVTAKKFIKDVSSFVEKVDSFKSLVAAKEINEATYMSEEALLRHVQENFSDRKPKKKRSTTTAYERSGSVSELAKRRAKGKCQLCSKPAPFKNKIGRPYLETHHIVWLVRGGDDFIENTVALCPNCHRKMHIVDSTKDVRALKLVAKSS